MSDSASLRRSRQAVLGVALVAAVAILLAAATYLGLTARADRQREASRTEAVHAARQEAVNLVTLDYRHLDADIANVLAGSTGDFHDQYAKGAAQVKKVVTDNKVQSTANIIEAGMVLPADADSVTVLVVVDSTVRNKANAKGQLRHYRMQLQMARQNGRWRTSSLDFVS